MLKSHQKTIFETLGRHPIHPFPARMAPGIALDALGESDQPLRVLDPMMGSGTVLAVARANGHRAFGYDIDPLAVLLARVWTTAIDQGAFLNKADDILKRAKYQFDLIDAERAFPIGCDEETRDFVRYWFDGRARRQLLALSRAIKGVRETSVREALWVTFSRLIITKSAGASLAMDLSHSRPHKSFSRAPVLPFDKFLSAAEVVASNCPHDGQESPRGPATVVKHGDARKMKIAPRSIDVVLTSPPYLNAIDYMRCSKFSLVWVGYSVGEIRTIRGESVGAETKSIEAQECDWVATAIRRLRLEPELSERDEGLLARYAWDMEKSLREAHRVLKVGGRAVYVVGNSTSRGTFIRNSSIVTAAAREAGFELYAQHVRTLPANRRYLPPPKAKSSADTLDARMRQEVVLVFDKAAA